MKKFILVLTGVIALMPAFLAACGEPVREDIYVTEEWDFGEIVSGESIVETPGGPGYAGNIPGTADKPLDPVEVKKMTLVKDGIEVNISYRETLKIWRSDYRYNIFNISPAGKTVFSPGENNISLYTIGAPKYMSICCARQWSNGITSSLVLFFQASEKISTGKHKFEIGIMVNGVDFGTVPCTVEILRTPVHPAF